MLELIMYIVIENVFQYIYLILISQSQEKNIC